MSALVMRVLYLVPGAGESPKGKRYTKVIKIFKKAGFEIVLVKMPWRRFDSGWKQLYARIVERAILKKKHEAYVLGFSWGAVSAFVAAPHISPKALILCSLSPEFSEDMLFSQQMHADYNLTRLYTYETEWSMKRLSFGSIARSITAKTFVLYGEKEPLPLIYRSHIAAASIPRSQLICVPKAGHMIEHPNYIKALRSLIRSL